MSDTNMSRRKNGRPDSQNNLTSFTLATDLEPLHFIGWSDAELATLNDLPAFLKVIRKRIENAGTVSRMVKLVELHGIVHNADKRKVWNPAENAYAFEEKFVHVQLVGKFAGRKNGLTLPALAHALGIEENIIEKPKRGKYAYDNMLAYLIHAKDEDKHQYDVSEVVTELGESYAEIWKKNKLSWEKGRAAKNKKRAQVDVDWLIDEARFGRITKRQIQADDDMYRTYSLPENKGKIESALQSAAERRMSQTVDAMARGEFSTTIMFIYGPSGTGKSILVKALNRYWREVNGWDVANLAASHAMDDYMGEDIIWLDDSRSGAMSAEDWIKLIDPHNANSASARYSNKPQVAPKVIVINSNKTPLEFFYYAKNVGGGDRSEAVDTFFRRLQWYITVLDPWELGIENCILRHPVKCTPYAAFLPRQDNGITKRVDRLTWKFEDALTGIPYVSPYLLAEYIVRIVDEVTGDLIAARDDGEALFAWVQSIVYQEQLPAMEKGNLPMLPQPDTTKKADMKLLNASAISSDGGLVDAVPTTTIG